MLERFFPGRAYASVFDVDYDGLYESGVRGLIFDIDNTLAPVGQAAPSAETIALIGKLRERFAVCLLSNNGRRRVTVFNEALGLPAVWRAGKPGKRAGRKALAQLDVGAAQTALIGDQLFTDIRCGNRCGMATALVQPISGREEWFVRLKRLPERVVLKAYGQVTENMTKKGRVQQAYERD